MTTLPVVFGMAFLAACAAAPVQEPLVSGLERSYERAISRAERHVVALWVDREPEPAAKRPVTPILPGIPHVSGGPFEKRPKGKPASGTIIDADGLILTSYFNVDGKVRKIEVGLEDGRRLEATLLGYHTGADIALLKVEAAGLPVPARAPLKGVVVAEPVVALGRAPDGKGVTARPGIVSALGRLYGRGVQFDGRLNYGDVGGPLVDTEGRLIGVTCKISTKSAGSLGQNSGISFAITWNKLDELMPDLRKGVRHVGTGRPFMGIQADTGSEEKEGVPIQSAVPGGSAEKAGIKPGDVILEFDGVRTRTFDDLRALIEKKVVGDSVTVLLRRGQEEIEINLVMGQRADD